MKAPTIHLSGKTYVIVERGEYERLKTLAKAAALPAMPQADAEGNVPAVQFARATLARSIIRDRALAGLTQTELAAKAGLRTETICRVERGRHTPSVETVQQIDRALKKALSGARRGPAGTKVG
jgi:DNA-binding XRE family transcriptional regulator